MHDSLLTAPSGVIPSDGEGDYIDVIRDGEGAILDHIFRKPTKDFSATWRDVCVIFISVLFLFVICMATSDV
jgi:hypothetical protein